MNQTQTCECHCHHKGNCVEDAACIAMYCEHCQPAAREENYESNYDGSDPVCPYPCRHCPVRPRPTQEPERNGKDYKNMPQEEKEVIVKQAIHGSNEDQKRMTERTLIDTGGLIEEWEEIIKTSPSYRKHPYPQTILFFKDVLYAQKRKIYEDLKKIGMCSGGTILTNQEFEKYFNPQNNDSL